MASTLRIVREVVVAFFRGAGAKGISPARRRAVVCGFLASGVRLAAGTRVRRRGARPSLPLVLWDAEGNADARSVRETLSELDLDAVIRPCPEGGSRFLAQLEGASVPRLEDPNAEKTLVGADAIVAHLYAAYGGDRRRWLLHVALVRRVTGVLVRWLTSGQGNSARASRLPEKPLELWSFEASPFCRFARQALTELELPYVLHNVAKGSPRRADFIAQSGKMQVPWLRDPNTGTELFESADIVRYLETTYGR